MSDKNFSFQLHTLNEAITPYGTIEIRPPDLVEYLLNDFSSGEYFRTKALDDLSLTLSLEDRVLTFILDESGSMTWNDHNGDRYTYLKRLLTKLLATYPGEIKTNLLGFGGVLTRTNLLITQAQTDFISTDNQSDVNLLLQQTFQDSTYDFAGIRITRRTDRFPEHPADGIIVGEGIFDAVKDSSLTEGTRYYYGIWSFNKNLHFSNGQFVSGVPADRVLPQGVNFTSASPRILPGIQRDEFTQIIYNLTEKSGTIAFDSSGQGNHGEIGSEVIEENFWLGDGSVNPLNSNGEPLNSTGVRFDGEFDIIETSVGDTIAFVGSSLPNAQSISVNFWTYRYSQSSEQWIIGTSNAVVTNTIGWAIGYSSDGFISFAFLDLAPGFITISTSFVPEETWTMVTVQMLASGTIDIYLNGVLDSTLAGDAGLNTAGLDSLFIGAKPTEAGAEWMGVDYFGLLAQISISNTSRSSSYIATLYSQELKIFNQTLLNFSLSPPDNQQREALLYWEIANDFDFSGGTIKIVRKYRHIPSHDSDGDVVLEQSASAGQFYYLDSFNFVHNADYYYRIFTTNSLGNVCDILDAKILPLHTQKSILDHSQFLVDSITEAIVTNGNKKVMLQWQNPDDPNWVGTKIFFGAERYPTISFSSQGDLQVSDGFEIYDTTNELFIHRKLGISETGVPIPLTNGKFHYYTIVSYDLLGNLSEPVLITGQPSAQINIVFPPAEIEDLHIIVVNPVTLSVQWINPVVRTDNLELFFGESALIFVSVKDVFGGTLDDILNINLQVCTTIVNRELEATDEPLGLLGPGDALTNPCGAAGIVLINGGCDHGADFEEDCNNEQETAETVLSFSTVQSGLIKGILTHTADRSILSRRERYDMDVRAQYKVLDPETDIALFEFNTEAVQVSFHHPIKLSLRNKLNKKVIIQCDTSEGIRGNSACPNADNCNNVSNETSCQPTDIDGTYIRSSQPYICRAEIQYKGESLPSGTPINVSLYKHSPDLSLTERTDRTTIIEGVYSTISVTEPQLDENNNPLDELVSKSVVDIEIPAPLEPDQVDLYVSLDYSGFFVDGVHTVSFISSVLIELETHAPNPNGINVSEQFATVWTVNPDDPNNIESRLPAPDGTLVKWELIKLRFGRERPFYSTEQLGQSIAGVYSRTVSGTARNVFLGPVGNITSHTISICDGQDVCCIGEEYAIKVTVVLDEQTAVDSHYVVFPCLEEQLEFENRRFLLNAADSQSGQAPNYITWADGEHLLHFQIAQNPALSNMRGAECFRNCVENEIGGQLFPFPLGHIAEISAYADILWNVVFEEDPYTAEITPVTFDIASPQIVENTLIPATGGIPITGETTDFYVRLNAFIGDKNPRPQDCEQTSGSTGLGSTGEVLLPCEWENVCKEESSCFPIKGVRWTNVRPINGRSTLLADNMAVTLFGGGDYDNGIPPVMLGFKEPLDVRVIETRINGERVNVLQELVVDGTSQHTFIVEVTFANDPVPDGTPVEISIEGENQNIVVLSNCSSGLPGCSAVSAGTVYTRLTNDLFINPTGEQRSFAYFSIDPLPDVSFSAKINVTCRYDKVGTATREITKCIQINNTVNVDTSDSPIPPDTQTPVSTSVSSNETLIYDTVQDQYEKTTSARINRIGAFAETITQGTDDLIYVLGGFTEHDLDGSKGISPTGEVFYRSTQEWFFVPDMPTPRCNGMTVTDGSDIYCIGGLEYDSMSQQYRVSRKIETFNPLTETWNETLASMPEDYGVAFGTAILIDQYIYVICGVIEVINNSQPETLNNRILRYSIILDAWDTIIPSEDFAYSRIAPFVFYRSNPLSAGATDSDKLIYVIGGSVPKPREQIESEFQAELNRQLNAFRSFILTSSYFLSLTEQEQSAFLSEEETKIRNSIHIAPFVYPSNGFTFLPEDEVYSNGIYTINIESNIDSQWTVLPTSRDRGRAAYMQDQDTIIFIGGSNQNQSTTLNIVDSINLQDGNEYIKLSSLSRGRAQFSSVIIGSDIYIIGGLTSGHKDGYVDIKITQLPNFVEALGTQSSGILITLTNDAGEIITDSVNCIVRGRIRIPELDSVLVDFLATRAADRALGGDGSGNAEIPETPDLNTIFNAQNSIMDPNSDEFQFNAAKKLAQQVLLFPVLYSQQEITISAGVGGTTLLPRSEDPLADFAKLASFIQQSTNIDDAPQTGDLTQEELFALGDILQSITLPPVVLTTNTTRHLYQIETTVTILDDFYFGQSVSDFEIDLQDSIQDRITDILTPDPPVDEEEDDPVSPGMFPGASIPGGINTECFFLQHVASNQIPPSNTPNTPNSSDEPAGTGGFAQSGQCLFCSSLLPLNPQIRSQSSSSICTFFNKTDWIPQIKKRLVDGNHTLEETIEELDIIDHEVPFGSSQLYNCLLEAARIANNDELDNKKKAFYVVSDNSQNLSIITRDEAIEAINSVDGDQKSPVVYVVFSTSFPTTISAQLERTGADDVEKITSLTGGQAAVLLSSNFLDQILNLTIGQATGGMGWGTYTKTIDFGELTAITAISSSFELPQNTNGYVRYKYSTDGYNFNEFSEKLEGTLHTDFIDFFAKILILEVVLTTGFTTEIAEEYDAVLTGLPRLLDITLHISGEKEDFIFLNGQDVETNAQQVAATVDGTFPTTTVTEIGIATSSSSNWQDFHSQARPTIKELGKTFLLQRDNENDDSVVGFETLTTRDGLLYKTQYGPWDPQATVELFTLEDGIKVPTTTDFNTYPRSGEIYFSQRQSTDTVFYISIINDNVLRVGIKFTNRLHTENIILTGAGYMFSTNDIKPPELSQLAPRALNLMISPPSPTAGDTIFALYLYIDPNNDAESSSIITWFKNDQILTEIQNKPSFTNTELTQNNKLSPGDRLHFTVVPSDGVDYGNLVTSTAVTVAPRPPIAENITLVAIKNGVIQTTFDTSSIFKVQYVFTIPDTGIAAQENGTVIKWFVNSSLFKSGIYPFTTGTDPRELSPSETSQGVSAHIIGNTISCEVTPHTSLLSGSPLTTSSITVVNTIPTITSAVITPAQPTRQSTLQLAYVINDPDITAQIEGQTDQSEIKWFASVDSITFTEITELRGVTSVPSIYLEAGQYWRAQVTGYDGLDLGPPLFSNTVLVSI